MRLLTAFVLSGALGCVGRMRGRETYAERGRLAGPYYTGFSLSGLSHVRIAGEEGGVTHLFDGELRLDVRGAQVTVAADLPPGDILAAVRVTHGWAFLVRRNDVYVSDTFTGRLRPLRGFSCDDGSLDETMRASAGFGRMALYSPAKGWFSTDGRVLRHHDVPGLRDLLFHGDALGAMIVRYRTVRVTTDGGATWRDVDLGVDLPISLESTERGLLVRTDAGWRSLDPQGVPHVEAQAPDLEEREFAQTPSFRTALMGALEHGYDLLAEATQTPCPRPPPPVPGDLDDSSSTWWRAREAQQRRLGVSESRWHAPEFGADLPQARPQSGRMPAEAALEPVGVPEPLGGLAELEFADTEGVPATLAVHRDEAPGTSASFAYRAEDGRGAFAARFRATIPREVSVHERWTLLAATRAGLLLTAMAGTRDAGSYQQKAYWFSATGAAELRGLPPPLDLDSARALATDDGGAVILSRWRVRTREASAPLFGDGDHEWVVVKLSATGAVEHTRVVLSHPTAGFAVGLGERDGRWGLVTQEAPDSNRLVLHAVDGGEVALGTWTSPAAVALCGVETPGGARLHVLHRHELPRYGSDFMRLQVSIAPRGRGPDFAEVRSAAFERAGDGAPVCVRRVWGVRPIADVTPQGGDRYDARWASLRLGARGGQLRGTYDTGLRVATVTATLGDAVYGPLGYDCVHPR